MRGKFWLGGLVWLAAAIAAPFAAPHDALADGTFMMNGQPCGTWGKDATTGTFHIDNCNLMSAPTPTPVPTSTASGGSTPTPAPTPPVVNNGNCPAGYTLLSSNLSFAANTFGLDFQSVGVGQTYHYCAVLPNDVSVLKVRTADRTGPSQCSNVTLVVTPPASSGIPAKRSNAVNNSINMYGVVPPYIVPAGTYLIDTSGGQPLVGCTTNQYMVYWQY